MDLCLLFLHKMPTSEIKNTTGLSSATIGEWTQFFGNFYVIQTKKQQRAQVEERSKFKLMKKNLEKENFTGVIESWYFGCLWRRTHKKNCRKSKKLKCRHFAKDN